MSSSPMGDAVRQAVKPIMQRLRMTGGFPRINQEHLIFALF